MKFIIKLKFMLKNPKYCDGCPWCRESCYVILNDTWCDYYNKKIQKMRLQKCIKENNITFDKKTKRWILKKDG